MTTKNMKQQSPANQEKSQTPVQSVLLKNRRKLGPVQDLKTQSHPLSITPPLLQRKLVMGEEHDIYEQEADRIASQVMRMPESSRQKMPDIRVGRVPSSGATNHQQADTPAIVEEVLKSSGQPLDTATRSYMETRFGHDFSRVRVHTGERAAVSTQAVNAIAYTVRNDVVLGAGSFTPGKPAGTALIAHELAHVVQQDGISHSIPEHQGKIQRIIEMRDVGRGERSGFARVNELITRLNAISQGLTFAVTGNRLTYTLREGGTLSNFDTQMRDFIDLGRIIPLKFTNRTGLLGDTSSGYNTRVDIDAWTSGYVDIDDLLASSDLGLQSVMVHFLQERSSTANYARRIGSPTFTLPEFRRVHSLGIGAEEALLRDYFSDPTIRIVNDSPSPTIRRVFRNSRRDLIRRRVSIGRGATRGVDAMSIDVVTRDGVVHTAEAYRRILEEERAGR